MRGIHLLLEKQIFEGKILCIDSGTLLTDILNTEMLSTLNKTDYTLLIDDSVLFSNNLNKDQLSEIWSDYSLTGNLSETVIEKKICYEAKDEESGCLSNFRKGCGKWIHTMKGCPFSSAGGMIAETMTVNELRIIELWRKMVPLYSAVL